MATTSNYSPIRDRHEGFTGCGCLGWFCFRWDDEKGSSSSHNYLLRETTGAHHKHETRVVEELKKLKEYSEVVAGPKWKNLIRKIGRLCNPKKSNQQFQYSPQSYALNFAGDEMEEDAHSSTRWG